MSPRMRSPAPLMAPERVSTVVLLTARASLNCRAAPCAMERAPLHTRVAWEPAGRVML